MNIFEFLDKKYEEREDKGNIFGVGISDREFVQFAINYLLGENWYVTDPLGVQQINELALWEILYKHSKRFRKERKTRLKKQLCREQ